MPTPLEPFVETKEPLKNEIKGEQPANILDSAGVDSQKIKQSASPRRKFQHHRSNTNRNNRNNSLNKRNTSDNNNNNNGSKQFNGYKAQNIVNQQKLTNMHNNNDFQKPQQNDHIETKKHSNKFRSITKMSNYYDDRSSQPALSPPVESQKPIFNIPQPKHELDNMPPRKYSIDFLHKVGYKISNVSGMNMPPAQHSPKTPKHIDEANLIALKMALGDNSGYYTHFYAGSMYGNQMVLHQQQQQLNQYARYQQQQQPPMQRLQRMYPRPQDNYQRVFQPPRFHDQEGPANLPCHCSQKTQQPQFQRGYSNSYSNSPSYQNGNKAERRDYRDNRENSKKSRFGNGYHQNGYKREYNNRNNHLGKSHSFSEEDSNKVNNFNRANSDDLGFRSLSPTPPTSSVSSSPGAHEKNMDKEAITSNESNSELAEDTASTASAASSVPSSSGKLKVSLSAPILMEPEEPSTKNVNLWIDNNFGGSKTLRNGFSVSAENLNVVFRDPPITIIKRPPSVHEVKRDSFQGQRSISNLSYDPQQPFDYYLSRAEESEMRNPPAQLRCNSKWDRLSEQMWEKFTMSQQSRSTYRKKMLLWRDLHEAVKNFPMFHQKAFPKWGLFLVGSTISGFSADSSDVDMCLVSKGSYHSNSPNDQRIEAMVTLNELMNFLLATKSSFQSFSLINAKVPILRFRDASNKIEVDLNFNNCVGVRNTQLLFSYSQLDWRLRPLSLIVKLWAQFHNINDARNSTISSYSLVLMVIHFLQYSVKPAVLPCLHQLCPEKFKLLHDITTIDMVEKCDVGWKSDNQQPLGELFLRFLDYYSNFDYVANAISIRTGGVLPIDECRNARSIKNDPNHWQTLCIEEPFDLTNTARSAYDGEIFIKIKDVFFQSWLRLKENCQLSSVFKEPLFTQQQQYMSQINHQIKYMAMPSGSGLLTMAPLSDVRS